MTGAAAAATVPGVAAPSTDSLIVVGARSLNGIPVIPATAGGVFVDAFDAVVRLDGAGLIAAPGLVDLQVNGAGGVDLSSDPEGIWDVAAVLPRFGVTRFLPTIVTAPSGVVDRALAALRAGPPVGWRGAVPLGLHLEGPMISPSRAGAHDRGLIVAPSPAAIAGWSRDAGVAMVTLAPEVPGAVEVTRMLAARGVVVAAGHTDADAACAGAAVEAGVTAVTHLFNAMAPFHHRDPGLVGAVMGGLPVTASLIADGVHLDAWALRAAWRSLGPGRRMLVSDATAALGAAPGRYRLAGAEIVSDGRVARDGTGGLAGTACGLDACVRHVVGVTGCAASEAVTAASTTPAALLGRRDLGTLRAGATADLVLLDGRLQVEATIVGGVLVHPRGD